MEEVQYCFTFVVIKHTFHRCYVFQMVLSAPVKREPLQRARLHGYIIAITFESKDKTYKSGTSYTEKKS